MVLIVGREGLWCVFCAIEGGCVVCDFMDDGRVESHIDACEEGCNDVF